VISIFDVLFHVMDDAKYRTAAYNLAGLLRPGGILFMSEYLLHSGSLLGTHQVCRSADFITGAFADVGLELAQDAPMFCLMNDPIDSPFRWQKRLFGRITRVASRGERWGSAVGATLLPLEKALVRLGFGRSTRVLVWQKPSRPEAPAA
jgi:hypothetical protein